MVCVCFWSVLLQPYSLSSFKDILFNLLFVLIFFKALAVNSVSDFLFFRALFVFVWQELMITFFSSSVRKPFHCWTLKSRKHWLKMRTYNEEMKYLEKVTPYCWKISKGFVDNMKVSPSLTLNSSCASTSSDIAYKHSFTIVSIVSVYRVGWTNYIFLLNYSIFHTSGVVLRQLWVCFTVSLALVRCRIRLCSLNKQPRQ